MPIARPRWWEGVDQDRARVGEEHRAAGALDEAPQDQPERARTAVVRIEGEHDRREGEHGESQVVDPHAPHDVAQTSEADDEHRGHEQVALQEPQ
jgi:hypothetical protein